MPMFDFLCDTCGHRFEELTRSSDTGKELRCPSCGEQGATKQLSGFAIGGGGGGGGGGGFGGLSSKSTSGGGCSPRGGFS